MSSVESGDVLSLFTLASAGLQVARWFFIFIILLLLIALAAFARKFIRYQFLKGRVAHLPGNNDKSWIPALKLFSDKGNVHCIGSTRIYFQRHLC